VLIVVVPIVAIEVLMFRLINNSEQGGCACEVLAAAAGSLYKSEVPSARTDPETIGLGGRGHLGPRLPQIPA